MSLELAPTSRPTAARRTSLPLEHPFSLEAAATFLCAFPPASGKVARRGERIQLAFALDGSFAPVAVSLAQRDGRLDIDFAGSDDAGAVRRQVARILSLDHDGIGWPEVAARDPLVAALVAEVGALRPVCFGSPYEAACWAVLVQRISMAEAARLSEELSSELGAAVRIGGTRLLATPHPRRILEVRSFPGLPTEKLARLHAVARAALAGRLDAAHLRAMPFEQALAELRTLRGIGQWSATHVLLRGAGFADEPAFAEPRVRRAYAAALGLAAEPSDAELLAAAERWRPYRTWVCVLLAASLARSRAAAPGGWTWASAPGTWR
jgi:DNA-3-methyladenine glycosylase II